MFPIWEVEKERVMFVTQHCHVQIVIPGKINTQFWPWEDQRENCEDAAIFNSSSATKMRKHDFSKKSGCMNTEDY